MKSLIVLAASCSFALTGCMRTYDLTREIPELARDEVDARLLGKMWTIERLDGPSMRGTITAAGPESITFVEEYSGQADTVSRLDLRAIRSSPGAAGPILGLLGGGLLGMSVGAAVGASQPTSHDLSGALVEPVVNGLNGAAVGAVIGAPLGLLIGGELSAGREYVFSRRESGRDSGIDTAIIIDRENTISQTDTSVTFLWEGKERTVSKNVAMIYPQGKKVCIVLPRAWIHR